MSYPKSGRTWLKLLLGKSLCSHFGIPDWYALDMKVSMGRADLGPLVFQHGGSALRDNKAFEDIHHNLEEYREKPTIILIRDPRDVVVSSYFQATRRIGVFSGTISEFIRNDKFGIQRICSFYDLWSAFVDEGPLVMLITYEDLKADPFSEATKVLDFFGLDFIDESSVIEAIEFSNFEKMNKMEKTDYFMSPALSNSNTNDSECFKVRKGIVGGYVNYLSEDDLDFIDKVMSKNTSSIIARYIHPTFPR
ncbi:MAG TPA: hypothetical protein ENI77_11240 [Nitrospirae bacterium]|nr:hypothetical protein [Nitrospirota bacterium]